MTNLLTDKEFAAILRLSPKNGYKAVQVWARAGKLKGVAVRVGDQWRFTEEGVMRWIEKGGSR